MTEEREPLAQWAADALREMEQEAAPELSPTAVFGEDAIQQSDVTDRRYAAADAVKAMGGTLAEQFAVLGTPARKSRRRKLEDAQKELGDKPYLEMKREQRQQEERRQWLATDWRYLVLSKCGRRKERARLVALLESNLDGSEVDLPEWISQAVGRIIEFDNRQPPEPHPAASAEELYRRLAEAYHQSQDTEA